MQEVNRSAMIVTAKQPFWDWLVSIDSSDSRLTLDDVNREPVIYLIAECESDEDFAGWIDGHFDEIFQEQLTGWWTDERSWPKKRTLELFRNWFDCRLHSVVLDAVRSRLVHID